MLYGGFREIPKFWQFSSIFLHKFFKNPVKHQKITQKNIQTYIIDVKFPAEYDPAVRKKQKNRGKPENWKNHFLLKNSLQES